MIKKINPEIFAKFWFDNAYHSSHIEGNKIDKDSVLRIVSSDNKINLNDIVFESYSTEEYYLNQSNLQKEIIEKQQVEIEGFKKAIYPFIVLFYFAHENYDLKEVSKIFHKHLMNSVLKKGNSSQAWAGKFKLSNNIVIGFGENQVVTSNVENIEEDLDFVFSNYNKKMKKAVNLKDKLSALAYMHIGFESIHPFIDGNGRTGRLLLAYETMRNNIPPFYISNSDRKKYLEAINECVIDRESKVFLKRIDLSESKLEKMVYVFSENLQQQLGKINDWDYYKKFILPKEENSKIANFSKKIFDMSDEFIDFSNVLSESIESKNINIDILNNFFEIENFVKLLKQNEDILNKFYF